MIIIQPKHFTWRLLQKCVYLSCLTRCWIVNFNKTDRNLSHICKTQEWCHHNLLLLSNVADQRPEKKLHRVSAASQPQPPNTEVVVFTSVGLLLWSFVFLFSHSQSVPVSTEGSRNLLLLQVAATTTRLS